MASEMKIELRQISASTSEATMGRHQVLIDRPIAKGGSDAGPMGGELFLAAVGGCFMSNLLAAIKVREADIGDVRVEVVGALADSPARFAGVELRVAAESGDRELLKRLVEIADRCCIMMNTLRGKLDVRVLIGAAV
jgi:putative redox protein